MFSPMVRFTTGVPSLVRDSCGVRVRLPMTVTEVLVCYLVPASQVPTLSGLASTHLFAASSSDR